VKMNELVEQIADPRVTARFVRYLIAEGMVPPPAGTRATADYGDQHLAAIHRYLDLRDQGFKPRAAKNIAGGAAPGVIPVDIGAGIVLQISPTLIDPALDLDATAEKIIQALRTTLSMETPDAERRPAE
jgi:MerR family copper efflux transcriptional regulator